MHDFFACSSIELEYRGHDPEVLKSYTKFLEVTLVAFIFLSAEDIHYILGNLMVLETLCFLGGLSGIHSIYSALNGAVSLYLFNVPLVAGCLHSSELDTWAI